MTKRRIHLSRDPRLAHTQDKEPARRSSAAKATEKRTAELEKGDAELHRTVHTGALSCNTLDGPRTAQRGLGKVWARRDQPCPPVAPRRVLL